MSKNRKKNTRLKQKSVNKNQEEKSLIVATENFLSKNLNIIFWAGMFFTVLFSVLIFDFKASVGGDDSAYIKRAYDLYHNFKYPSFQGPLYPMILSPFVGIFGINLTVLKIISLVFLVIGMFLFFRIFKNRIPALILVPAFLTTSVATTFLYYGSQTYSETLFFLLQVLLFYVVFKYFIEDKKEFSLKNDYKKIILLGAIMFVNVLTKNIAYAGIIGVVLFFLILKKYKTTGLLILSFAGFNLLWKVLKSVLWETKGLQVSSQGARLLQKHPYDSSKGQEDLLGFVQRFWDNTQIYLSKRFFEFTGWRPDSIQPGELSSISYFLGIMMLVMLVVALIFVFKKNKFLLFTVVYTIVMYGVTFIVLQKIWDSGRLIITYLPFTLITLFAGLYYISKSEKITWSLAGIFVILLDVVLIIMHKFKKTEEFNLFEMQKKTAENLSSLMEKLTDYSRGLLTILFFVVIPILIVSVLFLRNKALKSNLKTKTAWNKMLTGIVGIVFIMITVTTFISTFRRAADDVSEHSKIRKRNMKGDMLAGFTPDWRNYIKMTKYVAEKFPDSINIACRKPNIAFIYGQRKFQGIYKVPSQDPDTLLQKLRDMKLDYIIIAKLRKYEAKKTDQTINTIERFLYPIQKKYPGIFKVAYEIGKDEKATLVKIDYNEVK